MICVYDKLLEGFHVDSMQVHVPQLICIQVCLFEGIDSPFEMRNGRQIRHSSEYSDRSRLTRPRLEWLLVEVDVRRCFPSIIYHHWFQLLP